ncbi:Signal transduction histidine kinase [Chitinophaga costaii]|uniref:histidine kinase n=1 Tax=Chitinophaga costaii TaxID=1335309 RepID=A0A1C4FIV6_9BACT|nr:sensor histidine kinase [Chitinophaga costaii]PUZ20282.1 HAMP domain-containing protein [Chitinophaga costaii]SCC55401.1 Signal transduction histidine kinase [Chitinophaga costaii]
MKIKYKIALYYTVSAALVLVAFAVLVYYFSSQQRQAEYQERMEYRAHSIANVIIEGQKVKVDLLRRLERTTFQDLYKESILVYNPSYDLIYSNLKDTAIITPRAKLDYIKKNKRFFYEKANAEEIGIYHTSGRVSVIVIVSSFDKYGYLSLQNLKKILLVGLFTVVVFLVVIGYIFARKMVQPIDRLVQQVDSVNANNLQGTRVTSEGRDEIALLAANFNTMLQRLSDSFDLQKSFVSNASHELRTPLAAMISQLQVTLSKPRGADEYEEVLSSVLEDAENLSDLSNGLLQLAQSEMSQQEVVFRAVRIDELLLEMPHLIKLKQKNDSKIDIQFLKVPENDEEVTCMGNESLLKVLFLNLLDNACKFSADNSAQVSIDFYPQNIIIRIRDNGIGIALADQHLIFEPFYRGENALQVRGHGLGLSICKRIVLIHKGHISVSSAAGQGTTFTVTVPHL